MTLSPEQEKAVETACEVLERGGLVAFPTETVYGLGADADNERAVGRVFEAKKRPTWHPLIVHLPDADSLSWWASSVPKEAVVLAEKFWPGPLTMVLPRARRCGPWVTGGQSSVGLRCPSHPLGHALFKAFSGPAHRGVVGPSANSFGRISPTTPQHVLDDLGLRPSGKVDYILDGGPCTVGVESTIINLSGSEPELLRYGAITREMLQEALGRPVVNPRAGSPRVSGQLKSHYAPRTPLTLVEAEKLPEAAAALNPQSCAVMAPRQILDRCPGNVVFRLEAPEDEPAYAARLYSSLHLLDASGATHILVAKPPTGSIWAAVNDRLARAGAPRGQK
ncbi:L-threonylcarbamoyladenylate synthase [Mesosutterella sp. AGMB02718]|uniref:Threonylcarbamoyl-AMP synthase n=1 Tax=Mesosutterella faecium TaxID=2925194 RepID=A0ABT7IL31_9BURK|nr:L-threonylcarbamoyladenylate synthase [Mesosutterella sp. AGMB02718]MDL2059082.1 L-threonylcarbamoyladenylate synthase [Mesosutterella sp. AGMB02718]